MTNEVWCGGHGGRGLPREEDQKKDNKNNGQGGQGGGQGHARALPAAWEPMAARLADPVYKCRAALIEPLFARLAAP
jgi:hypothetical protein